MDKFSRKIYASLFFPFIAVGLGLFKVIALIFAPDGQLSELQIWLGLLFGLAMWIVESRMILKLINSVKADG